MVTVQNSLFVLVPLFQRSIFVLSDDSFGRFQCQHLSNTLLNLFPTRTIDFKYKVTKQVLSRKETRRLFCVY